MGYYTWFNPQVKANRDLTEEEIASFYRPKDHSIPSDLVPWGLSLVGKKEEFFESYESAKAYTLIDDLECFFKYLPKDVKLSGMIYCFGEDSTDIWAIEIGGNNEINLIEPNFDELIVEYFNKNRKWKDENSNTTASV